MRRNRTRSELLGQISQLKTENRRLQGTLDEIADIVNDEESRDETDQDYAPEDDAEEESDRRRLPKMR